MNDMHDWSINKRKGQATVEYLVIFAALALLTLLSLSTFYPKVRRYGRNLFTAATNKIAPAPVQDPGGENFSVPASAIFWSGNNAFITVDVPRGGGAVIVIISRIKDERGNPVADGPYFATESYDRGGRKYITWNLSEALQYTYGTFRFNFNFNGDAQSFHIELTREVPSS